MLNRASLPTKPLCLRRRLSLLGASLCSLLALMACSPKERPITGAGGSGGAGGATVSVTVGPGGAAPCETTDPDCECVGGQVVARDADGDLQGSKLCEAAAGADCDDSDAAFVKNECGGCVQAIGGKVGDACAVCGVLQCQGDSALECAAPTPAPRQCANNVVQVCTGAAWVTEKTCAGATPYCDVGTCVECVHGAFKCGKYGNDDIVIKCLSNDMWEPSWSLSCKPLQSCHSSNGTCVGMLFHPRDLDFEVPRLLRGAPGLPGAPTAPGLPTRDVLDQALGFAFG